jgi:hypothetical protein
MHRALVQGILAFCALAFGANLRAQTVAANPLPSPAISPANVVSVPAGEGMVLDELHQAALKTLSRLKPEDQVALFTFAARPERLEYLTNDRERIADRIATIGAGGGTNITDALFEAALYLGRAARGRRHALILVSDNEPTVRGYTGDRQVIRLALETAVVVYSIRIGRGERTAVFNLPLWTLGGGSVKKMAGRNRRGVIDAQGAGSVALAMATVISRLKQRYTPGYTSTNNHQDGAFRKIDVRLAQPLNTSGTRYMIYAQRGYYAPLAHTAHAKP